MPKAMQLPSERTHCQRRKRMRWFSSMTDLVTWESIWHLAINNQPVNDGHYL
jgi:hypothetical protein